MATYAAKTNVSTAGSQAEIQQTLKRYGATAFAFFEEKAGAMVLCEVDGRRYRFALPYSWISDEQFQRATRLARERRSKLPNRNTLSDQEIQQRWRALALYTKAVLEAVESGIITFERAMLPNLLLGDGRTVHETLEPEIAQIYAGRIPSLVSGGSIALPARVEPSR